MTAAGDSRHERRVTILVAAICLGLLALDVWLLIVVPDVAWAERLSFLLQVVGIFTVATGFIANSELSENFKTLLCDMTSANLRDFLYGNLMLGTVVTSAAYELYRGLLTASGWYASLLFTLLWLLGLPLILVCLAAYYVLVVPIAYVFYLAVSAPLLTIRDAQDQVIVRAGAEQVDVRKLLVAHMVPMRGFLVGAITTVGSLVLRAFSVY